MQVLFVSASRAVAISDYCRSGSFDVASKNPNWPVVHPWFISTPEISRPIVREFLCHCTVALNPILAEQPPPKNCDGCLGNLSLIPAITSCSSMTCCRMAPLLSDDAASGVKLSFHLIGFRAIFFSDFAD